MASEDRPAFEPPLFRASELKIVRASKHILELADVIAAHLTANPPPYIVAHSPEPSAPTETPGTHRVAFQMEFKFPGVPEEVGAIVGDVIHNLRAALDLLASDLVRANGKSPANVYFPFSDSAEEFDRMVKGRNFDRAGERAVELLREYQPYRGGNVALRAIHDLDVDDKHKFLIPNSQSAAGPPFKLEPTSQGLLEIVLVDAAPSPLLIVFPPGPFEGQEIVPRLESLVELTARIVESFKTLTL